MPLTAEQIVAKIVELGYEAEVCGEKVHIYKNVSTGDSDEPHDLVYDEYVDCLEDLRRVGLTMGNYDSWWWDNDSFGGEVIEQQEPEKTPRP